MTNRPNLSKLWASDGLRTDPVEKYSTGWVNTEKPENGHQNYLTYDTQAYFKEVSEVGIPMWSKDITYKEGSIVSYVNKVWVAKSGGSNHTPSSSEPYWEISFSFGDLHDAISTLRVMYANINDHKLNTGDPHSVEASQIGAYSKSEIDAKLQVLHSDIEQHKADKDNPHSVTYSQLGILPKSGGTFKSVGFEDGIYWTNGKLLASGDLISLGNSKDFIGIKDDARNNEELLIHEGNYVKTNIGLSNLYSVPPVDLEIAFDCSIHDLSNTVNTEYSWDNVVFTDNGLTLAGTVSFDAALGLGQETSIGMYATGHVDATIGDITMTYGSGEMVVQDGLHTIRHTGAGFFMYTRTKDGGILYLDGIKVSEGVYSARTTLTSSSITGSGSIKGFRIWSKALSKEQVSKIS